MKSDADMPIYNDFACVPITLDLAQDIPSSTPDAVFKEVMARLKKQTRNAKFMGTAVGWSWLMGTYLFPLIKPILAWDPSSILSYSTAVFSSVPGPVTPFLLDDGVRKHKVKSLYYFVPGAGRIGLSISAITQAG